MKANPYREAIGAISFLAVLILLLKPLLIDGTHIYPHDTAYYHFPTFHYFVDNLLNGQFPLWNPFSNGGQPFYPQLFFLRMLEPLFVALIFFFSAFTQDLTLLFNWVIFSLTLFSLLGTYLFLRSYTPYLWIRISLLAILMFSSPFIGSLRQLAFINQFLWVPWLAITIRRIVKQHDFRLRNWIFLGLYIGWSLQGYYWAGLSLFIIFSCLFFLITKSEKDFLSSYKHWAPRVLITFAVIGVLSLPALSIYIEKDKWVFLLRLLPKGFETMNSPHAAPLTEGGMGSYVAPSLTDLSAARFTSTHLNLWDLAQWPYPIGNAKYHGSLGAWGDPSEGYLYLGVIPFLVALYGLFCKTALNRKFWSLMLGGFLLLALGPETPIYSLLFKVLPPLWIVRHTSQFLLFVIFPVLVFFVIGATSLHEKFKHVRASQWWGATIFALCPSFLFSTNKEMYVLLVLLSLAPFFLSFFKSFETQKLFFLPLFFLAIVLDYGWNWTRISRLVQSQPNPVTYLPKGNFEIATSPRPPKFLNIRKTIPAYSAVTASAGPGAPLPEQVIRYLPLLYRTPTVFNGLYNQVSEEISFEAALRTPRWNELFMPKGYYELLHSSLPLTVLKNRLGPEKPIIEVNGSFSILSYTYQSLELMVESRGGPLLWKDGFDTHWTAQLNEQPISLLPVFNTFKAVQVPQGTHKLTFKYSPSQFIWSLCLFYLTSAACLSGITLAFLKDLKKEELLNRLNEVSKYSKMRKLSDSPNPKPSRTPKSC